MSGKQKIRRGGCGLTPWNRIGCLLVVAAICAIVALIFLHKRESNGEGIVLEDTVTVIENIRPRGEIYLYTALIEDFSTRHETSKTLFVSTRHSCVQTMTQKCSFVLDLDKIEYTPDDSLGVIYVRLPQPKYVAATQATSFLSDNDSYWASRHPDINRMKKEVEQKIRMKFDTPQNRTQSRIFAEHAIRNIIERTGYKVEFIGSIEQKQKD